MDEQVYKQVTFVTVVYLFATYLITPLLSPYFESLGYSEFELSIIFSVYPLAVIIFNPIIGHLSDKVGRRSIIRLGIAMEICAFTLYLYGSGHLLLLTLARCLNALSVSTVTLLSLAKINDITTNKERGQITGMHLSIQRVGILLAPVIGGFIADIFFVQVTFLMAISTMGILLFFLFVHARDKPIHLDHVAINPFNQIRLFLKDRGLTGMAIMGMAHHSFGASMMIFFPLFIIDTFGMGYKSIGVAFFFFGLAPMFQFIFGRLSDRFGRIRLIAAGSFAMTLFVLVLPYVENFYVLLVILVLIGAFSSVWSISAWSYLSDKGEKIKKEGRVISTYTSIAQSGSFVWTLVAGAIVTWTSIPFLFVINALVLFGCTVLGNRLMRVDAKS